MSRIQTWGVQGAAPSVGTVSGKLFNFLDPDPAEIDLGDIANGLAFQCRFNGQTKFHYSIAQHSVLVSLLCDWRFAIWGLFHDAAEAYLGDIPSPIKRNLGMDRYKVAEERLMLAVAERFGLSWPEPSNVKLCDRLAVFLELRDVMNTAPMKYGYVVPQPDLSALDITIEPMLPMEAKALFLSRAAELGIS